MADRAVSYSPHHLTPLYFIAGYKRREGRVVSNTGGVGLTLVLLQYHHSPRQQFFLHFAAFSERPLERWILGECVAIKGLQPNLHTLCVPDAQDSGVVFGDHLKHRPFDQQFSEKCGVKYRP